MFLFSARKDADALLEQSKLLIPRNNSQLPLPPPPPLCTVPLILYGLYECLMLCALHIFSAAPPAHNTHRKD
jgi:hypothetical protein